MIGLGVGVGLSRSAEADEPAYTQPANMQLEDDTSLLLLETGDKIVLE